MRHKPTFKQQLFAQEYVKNGGNGVQAATRVYGGKNYNTSKSYSTKALKSPIVQNEIETLLKRAGFSKQQLLSKLGEAVNSGIGVRATNSDALKGIDMMLKVYNLYPDKINKHLSVGVKYNFNGNMKDGKVELQSVTERSSKLLQDTV